MRRDLVLHNLVLAGGLCAAAVVLPAARPWGIVTLIVASLAVHVALRSADPSLGHRRKRVRGEERVGEVLDGLADRGWRVLHDVSLGGGTIDHVLVGPAGLLTVETKSRRSRLHVAALPPEWLRRADAQAEALERVAGRRVEPLLVLSDAWLDRAVCTQGGVTVVTARTLAGHLARRRPQLADAEVAALHAALTRALAA